MRRRGAAGVVLVPALALVACGGDAGSAAAGGASSSPDSAGAPALLPPVRSGGVEVSRAAVPVPAGGGSTALYLVIRDVGGAGDALLGVSTDAATSSSLHRTMEQGGLSAMMPTDSVAVPPGGEARLAPGGYHGMLEGLTRTLEAGDTVTVRLRFRGAGEVEVKAAVVPYAALDRLFPAPSGGSAGPMEHGHGGGEGG